MVLGFVADVHLVMSRVGVDVISFSVLLDQGPLIGGERFEALLLLGGGCDDGFQAGGSEEVLRLARTGTAHRKGQQREGADQPNAGEQVIHSAAYPPASLRQLDLSIMPVAAEHRR